MRKEPWRQPEVTKGEHQKRDNSVFSEPGRAKSESLETKTEMKSGNENREKALPAVLP